MPESEAEIRGIIAAQPTVAGSVAALVRYLAHVCHRAEVDDMAPLTEFGKSMKADPKQWYDAVFVNTPDALQASGMAMPARMGSADAAFRTPAEEGSDAAKAEEDRRSAQQHSQNQPHR
ncbi:MAG TPA: hypothetical protein VGI78_10715 [Acetobacteraceae bacterium]|jgi:hypothetical protein